MLAERMKRLGTETAFEVLARAKAMEAKGREIIHLEIGEPDFDTPRNIIDATIKALNEGYTHYGPSAGLPEARKTFAEFITADRGVEVGPENVVITPGAKPILFFSIMALCGKGDEVIYPNPGFPIYESVINFSGAKPVPIPLREEKAFSFDLDEMKGLVNDKTKLIIINSPHNPTGGVLTSDDMKGIAELAEKYDAWILSDEVYSKMIYEGEHVSIYDYPEVKDRTILLEGHSKTYAMTGWRLGYGVMPVVLADQISKLQTNSNSCTASFIQRAGIEAITGDQTASRKMMAEFKARRDLIVDGLNEIEGFTCLKPKGAFYVFPNITGTGMKSKQLEEHLLEKAGVAGLSGTSFGKYGEGYLRFSYANSRENLKKALAKIAEAL
ncbi:MAG TPA: pyridoxal phosphate-dependent aminotransferase [Candidatus Eisenbacteria bacterium]|uniref:Pyridoxal phosphate-dependent aminotransferase n=1 Tax=Eiseniibacteriota bacterium TaxID=2212470 RepID=A0A7V2AWB5_UNCEI|nr:pyridoxal phosphate-dependent aminotransferase [Candidatus Eisenbacteria bacterium]